MLNYRGFPTYRDPHSPADHSVQSVKLGNYSSVRHCLQTVKLPTSADFAALVLCGAAWDPQRWSDQQISLKIYEH